MEMLRPAYKQTLGWKIYEIYDSPLTQQLIGMFVFMFAINVLTNVLMGEPAMAAIGKMDDDGKLTETTFTDTNTKNFKTNVGKTFTVVRVVGSVIVACGLVMTAIRYRAEDQAQRAQELLIRGAVALLVINILPSIISFVQGAFDN